MSEQNGQNGGERQEEPQGITKITVGGYKSIAQEQSIEIRPLTILAGANSSGKSSIMQPLLLLKQTLEAPFDPGALLLNGPNVRFTSAEQLLTQPRDNKHEGVFQAGITVHSGYPVMLFYSKQLSKAFEVEKMVLHSGQNMVFTPNMTSGDISNIFHNLGVSSLAANLSTQGYSLCIIKNRCFLELAAQDETKSKLLSFRLFVNAKVVTGESLSSNTERYVLNTIHLPGLRGNPARTYPITGLTNFFPGTFENYTASVLLDWQTEDKTEKLQQLHSNLANLGLTNAVSAEMRNDAEVEIRVGRTLKSDASDMVSIADVGIGVSQTLPVLVALLAAKPGQLVYLEQPEIHLHPRAQTAMAQVLADAARRGVRVVAETHSSLLLLGVQTLVAEGKLSPELVKLHWFERGDDGAATIRSADLDEGGAFGEWPEDFGDASLDAQDRFLDAAEKHLLGI